MSEPDDYDALVLLASFKAKWPSECVICQTHKGKGSRMTYVAAKEIPDQDIGVVCVVCRDKIKERYRDSRRRTISR